MSFTVEVLPEDEPEVSCRPEISDGHIPFTIFDEIMFYSCIIIMLCGIVFMVTYAIIKS